MRRGESFKDVALTEGVATKVVGACCGLSAFAIAIVSGMSVDNPFEDVVMRALIGLVAGYAVGTIVGGIGEKTISDGLRAYKATHPIGVNEKSGAGEKSAAEVKT